MARTFGTAGDTINIGSPAVLDNLLASGSSLFCLAFVRTAGGQVFLLAKHAGIPTTGYLILIGGHPLDSFTTEGHVRVIVGTDANFLDLYGGANPGDDIVVQDEWTFLAVEISSAGAVKIYRSALKTPVTEVSGYHTAQALTGNLGADATGELHIGNAQASDDPLIGQHALACVYNKATAWALDDIRSIQLGMLTYLDCLRRGVAVTRATAIWQAVSGYKLLHYTASDGTLTDHSGNGNNGTLTGTTSGTDLQHVVVPRPGDLHDNLASGLASEDQVTHLAGADFSGLVVDTSATAYTAWVRAVGLDPATYPNQTTVGVDIDGAWERKLSATAQNAWTGVAVSGLSASSKRLDFRSGPRSVNTLGQALPWTGTVLGAVVFDATPTVIAPTARTRAALYFGDSAIMAGFLADSPGRYASPQVLRRNRPAWCDGVLMWSAGGLAWHDLCSDSTKRAATIALIQAQGVVRVGFSLMANDHGRNAWAAATAATSITTLLDDLLAAWPGHVDLFGLTITTAEASANSFGDTYPTWRTMLAGLVRQRVRYVNTLDWMTTDGLADAVHPSTAGHQTLYTSFSAEQAAARPFSHRLRAPVFPVALGRAA